MEERFLETTGDFLARREDDQDLDYTQAVDEARPAPSLIIGTLDGAAAVAGILQPPSAARSRLLA